MFLLLITEFSFAFVDSTRCLSPLRLTFRSLLLILKLLLVPAHVIQAFKREFAIKFLFDVPLSELGVRLIERVIVQSPLDPNRLIHSLQKHLVVHGLPGELSEIAMSKLDVRRKSALVEMDVLYLTVHAEVLIDQPDYILDRHAIRVVHRLVTSMAIGVEEDLRYAQCIALLVK